MAKKLFGIVAFGLIVMLVLGVFVSSQVSSDVEDVELEEGVDRVMGEKVERGEIDEDVSNVTKEYVKDFVKKRGINPEDVVNVSNVDYGSLPEEVKIDSVENNNLGIYEVNFNDSKKNEQGKVFVVSYSAENIATTKDLIAHSDKRQFLDFGIVDEVSGSSFMNTATGVPGDLNVGYVMMRQGSITGMSTNLQIIGSEDGETLEVIIYKNGEAIRFGNVLDASEAGIVKDYDTQSKGVVIFNPGDTISVQIVGSDSVSYKNVVNMIEITTVD